MTRAVDVSQAKLLMRTYVLEFGAQIENSVRVIDLVEDESKLELEESCAVELLRLVGYLAKQSGVEDGSVNVQEGQAEQFVDESALVS